MLMNLKKKKKTKLAFISLAFVVSSVLCGAGATKIISIKAGQSIDIDNVKIVCETTSNTTGNLDIEAYKKTRDMIVKFCRNLGYTSAIEKCLAVNAKYVQPEALKICANLGYVDSSVECLKAIANKVYSDEELRTARNSGYINSTIKILQQTGATI